MSHAPPATGPHFHLPISFFPQVSMGCGASKCSFGDDPLPAGLRPLCCSGGCGSISKMELLSKGDRDVPDYPVVGSADHGRTSMSSTSSSEDGRTRLMKMEMDPDAEEARRASENESGSTSLSPIQEEDSGSEEEMGERGGEKEGDEEEEKNNEKSSFEEFGLVGPRSPSFREYCTTDNGKNDDWQSDQKNANISNSTQAVKKVKEGRAFSKTIMNVMNVVKSPLSRSSQVNASASD